MARKSVAPGSTGEADPPAAQLSALKAQLADVQSKLTSANQEIKTLNHELRLKSATATMQTGIRETIVRRSMAISAQVQQELLAVKAERDLYRRQLREVLHSRSWRLLNPIRGLVSEWRRLRAPSQER